MKTLLAILNGGEGSPKITVRHLGLGIIYALGALIILLQLRSLL